MLRLSPAKPAQRETAAPAIAALPLPIATTGPQNARIEAYLDRVEAAMTALPPGDRAERRRELRQHLDATRAALEELGDTPESAVAEALHRLGAPETIARAFNRAWTQTATRGESPWPAMRLGLCWFGTAFAAFLAVSLLATGSGHPLWANTQWSFAGLAATPCLLGTTLGARIPQRAGMGTFYALAILTLGGLALTALAPSSLSFSVALPAGGVFACWIPLGSLAATAASCAVQAHRRFRTR
jgi:hypothetical protein